LGKQLHGFQEYSGVVVLEYVSCLFYASRPHALAVVLSLGASTASATNIECPKGAPVALPQRHGTYKVSLKPLVLRF